MAKTYSSNTKLVERFAMIEFVIHDVVFTQDRPTTVGLPRPTVRRHGARRGVKRRQCARAACESAPKHTQCEFHRHNNSPRAPIKRNTQQHKVADSMSRAYTGKNKHIPEQQSHRCDVFDTNRTDKTRTNKTINRDCFLRPLFD
jgi:hypothetical protein